MSRKLFPLIVALTLVVNSLAVTYLPVNARGTLNSVPAQTAVRLNAPAAVSIAATMRDSLLVDNNSNTQADPGDALRYTVIITDSGGTDATGVAYDDNLDANSTLSGTVRVSPVAVNDSYNATGNVSISVPAGSGVLSNDYLGQNSAAIITAFDATSTQGGTVTMNADGSFTYNPPGAFTGTDTFGYTLSNSVGSNSATVTITVSDRILFVSAAGSGTNCKPATPCTLATADGIAAISTGKDLVFVESGTYNSAAFTLNAAQSMAGQGISLAQALTDAGITLASNSQTLSFAASTTPVLNNSGTIITLATNSLVEDLSLNPSGGSAVIGNGITTGTVIVRDLTITATSAASGVTLTSNTGGTFNFSNIGITAASGAGFSATGGGTLNVTGTTNTLATTTGAALSVVNTTIGASGLTFRSISAGTGATGPTNGILLNNTGSSGRLTVTGDGTTNSCRTGNTACSGGTIQHTTGDGISLTSTRVDLSLMWIKNNANSGIKGTTISGFKLTDVLIQNNTNSTGEQAGILVNDLTDSAALVTRAEVSGSTEDNVRIHNTNTTGAITFTGCTILDNSTASGNMGIFFQTNLSGNLTGTVQNSTLHGNRTIALRGDSGDSSTLSATFINNTITAGSPNQGNQGIEVSRAGTSSLTFNVDSNTVSGMISTLINVFSGGGPGTATGVVKNNIVTGVGLGGNQYGIRVFNSGSLATGSGTIYANVANNTVSAIDNAYPILGESSGSTGSGALLQIALTGNNASVASPGGLTSLDAIRVQARNAMQVCARISGNITNGGGLGFFGIYVRQANTAVFNLEGGTANLAANNPSAVSTGSTGTITTVGANSCSNIPALALTAPNTAHDTAEAIDSKTMAQTTSLQPGAAGQRFTADLPARSVSRLSDNRPDASIPSVNIGALPAGKSITIIFDVSITTPWPNNTFAQISNQGTVSGGNFSSVMTDDPDTGAPNDPTVTTINLDITYVDPGGTCAGNTPCYTSPQLALDSTTNNGAVNVFGTNNVGASLTSGGSGNNSVVISGTGTLNWTGGAGALFTIGNGNVTIKGLNLTNAPTVFNQTGSGTLTAYANNITAFTTAYSGAGTPVIGHNYWGMNDPLASAPTGMPGAEWPKRLGAPVSTWADGATGPLGASLGGASLTGGTGGTLVVISHGRGSLSNVPFGNGTAPYDTQTCSAYYDFFTIGGTGPFTAIVPIDNNPNCNTNTRDALKVFWITNLATCSSSTPNTQCWSLISSGTSALSNAIQITGLSNANLGGTPFVAGDPTGLDPTAVTLVNLRAEETSNTSMGWVLSSLVALAGLGALMWVWQRRVRA